VNILNFLLAVMMEYQKRREQRRRGQVEEAKQSAAAMTRQIFAGVALNPVVLMTILGIIGNFVFHHSLPHVLSGILKASFKAA
jgi:hypothetical protein